MRRALLMLAPLALVVISSVLAYEVGQQLERSRTRSAIEQSQALLAETRTALLDVRSLLASLDQERNYWQSRSNEAQHDCRRLLAYIRARSPLTGAHSEPLEYGGGDYWEGSAAWREAFPDFVEISERYSGH